MVIKQKYGIEEALPGQKENAAESPSIRELVAFEMRERRWAIDARYVTAVRLKEVVTPLPGSDRHLLGLIDILGSIVPVFSLSELLGLPRSPFDLKTCNLIVVGENKAELGLQFTGMSEFVSISDKDITYSCPDTFPEPSWVIGVLRNGTIVLDGGALLSDRSFVVGQ